MQNLKMLPNKKNINTRQKRFIPIFTLLCLFWIISFFKIPVVGKIIDAIFFEFLFGYSKLIIYLLFLIMLCTWYFQNIFYTLFSKRKLLSFILIIFLSSLILGVISYFSNSLNEYNYVFKEFFVGKEYSFFDRWVKENIDNLLNIKQSVLILNKYAFGGFIGTLYVALTNQTFYFLMFFILALIFVVIVFVCVLCWNDKILNKLKNKILKYCGTNKKELNISNKLSVSSDDNINKQKELLITKFNLEQKDIEIIDKNININFDDINKMNTLINQLKELKIENIEFKFKLNNKGN